MRGKYTDSNGEQTAGVDLAAKVRFLRRRSSYPHRPANVDTKETHTSWLFLANNLVYKLKKPLRYDFLDFSTVQARRCNCEEEVRLNRRFSPEVYLGTEALTMGASGGLRLGGCGAPVDWLVKMQRLPDEVVLETRLHERTLGTTDIVGVASLLCRFYESAPSVAITPSAYLKRFTDDIHAYGEELCNPEYRLSEKAVTSITEAQLRFTEGQRGLLTARVDSGRIVEGHGDLRPEHIYVGRNPIIIDCLEFNRDFRLLDPLDELGFLAMECERLGAPFVGHVLFSEYERATSDHAEKALVHFYMSYRALLWGNLSIRHLDRLDRDAHEKWIAKTTGYLRLAEEHIRKASQTD